MLSNKSANYTNETLPNNSPITFPQIARVGMGLILIVTGLGIALWLFITIYIVLNSPEQVDFFFKIIPAESGEATIMTDAGPIIIPTGFFVLSGYFLMAMLLAVIGNIAGILLKSGAGLLQSDLKILVDKLVKELKKTPYVP